MRWTGRVVVRDAAGVERPAESGSFQLYLLDERGPGARPTIAVRDGRFEAEPVRPGARFVLGEAEPGGRATALARMGETLVLPADGRLDLEARWPARCTIHVLDAATRAPLSQVEVLGAVPELPRPVRTRRDGSREISERMDDRLGDHPGLASDRPTLVLNGKSPLGLSLRSLSYRSGAYAVFVRAPGRAWRRLILNFHAGGESQALLEPGGDLIVTLSGIDPGELASLRVRAPGERFPLVDQPLETDGALTFEGLPLGALELTVETGLFFRSPRVLARGSATIEAQRVATAALSLPPRRPPSLVSLGGTVVFPPPWSEGGGLRLRALDPGGAPDHALLLLRDMTPTADGWRWRFDGLAPGRYEVGTVRPPWRATVELGPGGRDDVALGVPPAGRVRARVLDATTEEDAGVASLSWMLPMTGPGGGHAERVRPDPGGAFVFDAPQGAVEVHVHDARFTWDSAIVMVLPGATAEVVLRVRRVCRVRLDFTAGGLPLAAEGVVDFGRLPGGAIVAGSRSGGLEVALPGPGRYVVGLVVAPGYAPVADLELEVGEEETTRTIPLERATLPG